jgi:hypothetical protein
MKEGYEPLNGIVKLHKKQLVFSEKVEKYQSTLIPAPPRLLGLIGEIRGIGRNLYYKRLMVLGISRGDFSV